MFLLRLGEQLINALRLIILARILGPGDFGIMGAAFLISGGLQALTQTGFSSALIAKKSDITGHLDTVWTTSVLRGAVVFFILIFFAPIGARFFRIDVLEYIIWVAAAGLFIESLANVGIVYFEKELEFHKIFFYQLSGAAASFVITVFCALSFRNVWALVWGFLAGAAIKTVISYLVHPYRPVFRLDIKKLKELFNFGKWIFGSGVLVFFLTHGDDLFVGKFIGLSALGLYQMAYKISNVPATEFSHLVSSVIFPAYSKAQDDIFKVSRMYEKILQFVVLISMPLTGLIFILAPEYTRIFLGEKWMAIVPALRVLSVYGLLRALGATTGVVFIAIGKPHIRTKIQSLQLILLALIIYPLTISWGIVGTSAAVTIDALIFNIAAVWIVCLITGAKIKIPALTGIFSLLGVFAMMGIILFLKNNIFENISIVSLIFFVFCGVSLYCLVIYLTNFLFQYLDTDFLKKQTALFLKNRRNEI